MLVRQVRPVSPGIQDRLVMQEHQGRAELLDLLEQQVTQAVLESPVGRGPTARLVLQVRLVRLAILGRQGQQVVKERMELLARLVTQEIRAHSEIREILAQLVRLEGLD
jgi:hypothetical protein